jgi:integrase/recombinase XerD
MLGHASLSSTEIYTHVSIAKLQEIHRATHPARWQQAATPPGPAGKRSPSAGKRSPSDSPPPPPTEQDGG